jgi:hypothetical protein
VNGHDRGGDQADRVLCHRPHHFLAPLAANQPGFALLFCHGEYLEESVDQFSEGVKATPSSTLVEEGARDGESARSGDGQQGENGEGGAKVSRARAQGERTVIGRLRRLEGRRPVMWRRSTELVR